MFYRAIDNTTGKCGHCGRTRPIRGYKTKGEKTLPVCEECVPGVVMIEKILFEAQQIRQQRAERLMREMGHR